MDRFTGVSNRPDGGPLADLVIDLWTTGHDLSPALLASQLATAVIVMLGLVETLWLLMVRPSGFTRRRTVGDATASAVSGLGGLLVGLLAAGWFTATFGWLSRRAPTAAVDVWAAHPIVAFAAAFVAWDLAGHVYHRVGHETAIGWAAHRPHHTGEVFSLALAWRQSWLPIHAVVLPFVALGGWSLGTIIGCAAVSNVIQAIQHSAALPRLPRWAVAVIMTPQQHRHHHLEAGLHAGATVNLGPVFTVWDRLAGTYLDEPTPATAVYGATGPGANPWRSQTDGWLQLVRPRPPV